MIDAFYLAGLGDGIDFATAHAESSTQLAANLLTERFYAHEDGKKKANPHKLTALEAAKELQKKNPTYSKSRIAQLTHKRLLERGIKDLPSNRTIENWLYEDR